ISTGGLATRAGATGSAPDSATFRFFRRSIGRQLLSSARGCPAPTVRAGPTLFAPLTRPCRQAGRDPVPVAFPLWQVDDKAIERCAPVGAPEDSRPPTTASIKPA